MMLEIVMPKMLTSSPLRTNARGSGLAAAALMGAALLLGGCSGGGGSTSSAGTPGGIEMAKVEFGRLFDVYGLDPSGAIALFQKDVLVGSDIRDGRPTNSSLPDAQVSYDILSSDPDTLQPRVLIPRPLGSQEFKEKFEALDDKVREVTPAQFAKTPPTQPYSVVPRNAGIRLTFTGNVGVTDGFFVERDETGKIVGQINTEAVQVLEIVGDPTDETAAGDFRVIPTRVVPRANQLILDPVLLGSEGLQYQSRNNAAGLPESPNQIGANIRIAVALEGPLAIPGIRPDRVGALAGLNNSGQNSVIRDFRSGNRADDTPEISQGFIRDPTPPRISGEIVMYLERVDDLDGGNQILTFFKNGVQHEIDRGDTVRLIVDNSGVPAAVTEVVLDPTDDAGQPGVQHVRVTVRRQFRTDASGQQTDIFQDWDPSDPTQSNQFWTSNAGIPPFPSAAAEREAWLVEFAPQLVLVAEFTAERFDANGNPYGDQPRYFVTFSPEPLPGPSGERGEPNQNVSPSAAAILRFTKPIDLKTVRGLDTFFFATRDLLDQQGRAAFIADKGINPSDFSVAKYYTPHLVGATVFDAEGSATTLRLQPSMGFYLDDTIRTDEGVPFAQKNYLYYLHVVGGPQGIRDLSGNPIDFQTDTTVRDDLVIPFSLDTRSTGGKPNFPDNISVTVARRLDDPDEDEQPSYYLRSEVPEPPPPGGTATFKPEAYRLRDLFGPVVFLPDGTMSSRPTARVRQVVDDRNQQSPPAQSSSSRYCPLSISGEANVVTPTGGVKFGSPLQNPLNPFGCRLQTVWREIDMSLSRTDPLDFNLDVEQMYWAPFTQTPVQFDEFDQVSLFLGHAEFRPEPCVGSQSSMPSIPTSGLSNIFGDNYLFNLNDTGTVRTQPSPHPAYVDQVLMILSSLAVFEPNGVNRFLPLPTFQKPYFVWRDELQMAQGGDSSFGNDGARGNFGLNYDPYILSPFLTGRGRYATLAPGPGGALVATFNSGAWDNRAGATILRKVPDKLSGGLVGSIALPLLADFWTYPDKATLPVEDPFVAAGINGWQISLAVQSSQTPNFRTYSAGGVVGNQPQIVEPTSGDWLIGRGGWNPTTGQRTISQDNSVFWIMTDFIKRQSVITSGFVEVLNPHRMPGVSPDPRLGPYFNGVLPPDMLPQYSFDFEPSLQSLPGGTRVEAQFRGAGPVDDLANGPMLPAGPWAAAIMGYELPDATNFPLDPLKAGDAHIHKFDDRVLNGQSRNTWTYYYNRHVTDYTTNITDLSSDAFTTRFGSPTEPFPALGVTYFNWRFVFENNVNANPPISPVIDSFMVTYRFQKTR